MTSVAEKLKNRVRRSMAFVVTVFAHLPNQILFENVYVTKVVEDGPMKIVRPLHSPSPVRQILSSPSSSLFSIGPPQRDTEQYEECRRTEGLC